MSKTVDIEEKEHSKLSFSGSKRWLTCAGSVQLCQQVNPDNIRTSSRFAAEGTVAHEICDLCIAKNIKPEFYLGKKFSADGFTFTVNQEMVDAVQSYVDYIAGITSLGDCVLESEVKSSLEHLKIDGLKNGTTDALITNHDNKTIYVIDFKYGQGVAVEAIENTQLMMYGLGGLYKLIPTGKPILEYRVILVIVQPRAFHPAGPIREWEISVKDLYKWQNEILIPRGNLCNTPNPPLKTSDEGCRFCEAAGTCPELHKETQKLAIVDFDQIEVEPDKKFPTLPELSPEQKLKIMEHATAIRAFIVAVENQIKVEMERGSKDYDSCFKLVRKQTRRQLTEDYADPDLTAFLDYLTPEKLFVNKLRPMGEIERMLKVSEGIKATKEIMAVATTKPEGEIVVAKLSDKRKAVEPSATRDFSELSD